MADKIDWNNIGFDYRDINCYVQYTWKNGKWGEVVLNTSPYINIHVGATVFHYGQAIFEGLKAFRGKDGKIRVFRPDKNAERFALSSKRIMMPEVPKEMFLEAVKIAVQKNHEFVPPYGSGGSLYIRPVMFGSGPKVGLKPSDEFLFIVIVTPVGQYYKSGMTPVPSLIMDDYDRAAPLGVGYIKVAGNYASALYPNHIAEIQGIPITLFLDAKEHKYIEEFNSSNFVAINKNGTYITPQSSSILESVTNNSLMILAKDEGIEVQVRQINFEEEVGTLTEVGAVGTAVIITPINRIIRGSNVYSISEKFPILEKLYNRLKAIQAGDEPDKFLWLHEISTN